MGTGTAHIQYQLSLEGDLLPAHEAAWTLAKPLQEEVPGLLRHSQAVLENIGLLLKNCDSQGSIPKKGVLVLSLACALHDIARLRGRDNHDKAMAQILSENEVIKNALSGHLPNFGNAVADVIRVHDNGEIETISETRSIGSPPRLQMWSLASLFRLADCLDTTSDRSCWMKPVIEDRVLTGKEIARQAITGWDFHRTDSAVIMIEADTSTEEKTREVEIAVEMMDDAITVNQERHLSRFIVTSTGKKEHVLRFPSKIELLPYAGIDEEKNSEFSTSHNNLLTSSSVDVSGEAGDVSLQLPKPFTSTSTRKSMGQPRPRSRHQQGSVIGRFLKFTLPHNQDFLKATAQATASLAEECNADCVRVFLRHDNSHFHIMEVEHNPSMLAASKSLSLDDGLVGWTIRHKIMARWPNNDLPHCQYRDEYAATDERVKAEMVAPLVLGDMAVGAILVDWTTENVLTDSTIWDPIQLKKYLEPLLEKAQDMGETIEKLYKDNELHSNLSQYVRTCLKDTNSDRGYVALWSQHGGLEYYFARPEDRTDFRILYPTEGVCGMALRTGQTVNVKDLSTQSEAIFSHPKMLRELVFPIKKNNVVIGIINVERKGDPYARGDECLLEGTANAIAEDYIWPLEDVLTTSTTLFLSGGRMSEQEIKQLLLEFATKLLNQAPGIQGVRAQFRDPNKQELNDGVCPDATQCVALSISGRPIAVLNFDYPVPAPLSKAVIERIQLCAQLAASAIDRRRRQDRRESLARLLAELSRVDLSRADIDTYLRRTIKKVNWILEATHTTLLWQSYEDASLFVPGISTAEELYSRREDVRGYRKDLENQGVTGYVLRTKGLVRIPNLSSEKCLKDIDPGLKWQGLLSETRMTKGVLEFARSYLGCVIRELDGNDVQGVLRAYVEDRATKPSFSDNDEHVLRVVAQAISPLLARAREIKLASTVGIVPFKEAKGIELQRFRNDPKKIIPEYLMPPQLMGYTYSAQKAREARDADRLLSIRLETSLDCNLQCRYCCNSSGEGRSGEIDYEKRMQVLFEARQLGAESVVFIGGGEFLMHKNADDLLKFSAKTLGLLPVVFTNGKMITEERAKMLHDCGASVILKLDSLRPGVQDYLANEKGYHRHFLRAIECLRTAGYDRENDPKNLRLGASCAVTRMNFKEVVKIWQFCRENGLFPNIEWLVLNGRAGEDEALPVEEEIIHRVRNDLYMFDHRTYGYKWIPFTPRMGSGCLQFIYSLYVTYDGFVRPCASLHYQPLNVQNESLSKIIHSDLYKVARHIDKYLKGPCGECKFNFHCCGCRGRTFTARIRAGDSDMDALTASDPSCPRILDGKSPGVVN